MVLADVAIDHTRDVYRRYGVKPSPNQLIESAGGMLLKKEVIQPQVPLRLPCYDFIPVTNHTFGVSLSVKSWGNDFGCNQLP